MFHEIHEEWEENAYQRGLAEGRAERERLMEQNGTRGDLAERYVSERMAECQTQVDELLNQATQREKDINKLKAEVERLINELEVARGEIERLREQAFWSYEVAELISEVERLTAECERLRKEAMDWSGVAGKNLAHAEYADAALEYQRRHRRWALEQAVVQHKVSIVNAKLYHDQIRKTFQARKRADNAEAEVERRGEIIEKAREALAEMEGSMNRELPYVCPDHPDALIRHRWDQTHYVMNGVPSTWELTGEGIKSNHKYECAICGRELSAPKEEE